MNLVFAVNGLFCAFSAIDGATRSAGFVRKENKRLTSTVTKIVATDVPQSCVNYCLATDGCLAVNFLSGSQPICELTSGFTNKSDLLDVHNSAVNLIDKCTQQPGYCLNGATCEPTEMSGRCNCTERYQGDRCDKCTERFHGDGCQQCSLRFQGEDCQECASRFQGDECQTCTDGYYGETCGYWFPYYAFKNCDKGQNSEVIPHEPKTDHESCKVRCAAKPDCGGFVIYNNNCHLKSLTCESNIYFSKCCITYLKKQP